RRDLSRRRLVARRLGVGRGARFELRVCYCGRHSFAGRFVRGTGIDEFRIAHSFRSEAFALATATIAPAATAAAPAPAALTLVMRLDRSFALACASGFTRLLQRGHLVVACCRSEVSRLLRHSFVLLLESSFAAATAAPPPSPPTARPCIVHPVRRLFLGVESGILWYGLLLVLVFLLCLRLLFLILLDRHC